MLENIKSGLDEIRATININGDSMRDNKELTNEFIADDFFLALGYNKKRDMKLKRITDTNIMADWVILDDSGTSVAIIVRGYKSRIAISKEEMKSILSDEHPKYDIYLATDFERCFIYLPRETEQQIAVINTITGENIEILEWLEKDNVDYSRFEGLHRTVSERSEEEKIRELLKISEERNGALAEELVQANQKITELNKLKEEKESYVTSNSVELNGSFGEREKQWKSAEISYKKRIEELTAENSKLTEELHTTKASLKSANSRLIEAKKADETMMQHMIQSQDNDNEGVRRYLGVINLKMKQNENLPKFIGACIKELFTIVGMDLMSELFDGDQFRLLPAQGAGADLIMQNKTYNIDTTVEDEQVLLEKLDNLMKKFPEKVTFGYRTFGKAPVKEVVAIISDEERTLQEADKELEIFDSESDEQIEIVSAQENNLDTLNIEVRKMPEMMHIVESDGIELIDNIPNETVTAHLVEEPAEAIMDSDEKSDDEAGNSKGRTEVIDDGFFDDDNDIEDTGKEQDVKDNTEESSAEVIDLSTKERLFECDIRDIGELAWAKDVDLKCIAYIEISGKIYETSDLTKELSKNTIAEEAVKCIDALLASTADFGEVLNILEKTNLTGLSQSVVDMQTDKDKAVARIAFTKYGIMEVDAVSKVVPIIAGIAKIAKLKPKLYMYGYLLEEKSEMQTYIFEEELKANEAKPLLEDGWKKDMSTPSIGIPKYCVVYGNILDKTLVTKGCLKIQAQLLKGTKAVKCGYFDGEIDTEETLKDLIQTMLDQEDDDEILKQKINKIGRVIDTKFMILSDKIENAYKDFIVVWHKNKEYYFSNMEGWRNAYSIIRMNLILTGSKQFAIRCEADLDALKYYSEEFTAKNPTLELTVRSLLVHLKLGK